MLCDTPTPGQTRAISKLCMALGIRDELEQTVKTRQEARDMIYDLRNRLRAKGDTHDNRHN